LISVIIPVYNMESYLKRCLDSVIENTWRNLEILCVNDGSKDSSAEILQEYAKKDPRITVITKENGGLSSARNAGFAKMTGEFVTFVDSDDFVHPQFFELLIQAQKETGADVVNIDFLHVTDEDLPVRWEQCSFDRQQLLKIDCGKCFKEERFRSYVCSKMIKRDCIGEIRFREYIAYAEDSVFIAEVWEKNPGLICYYLDQKLYGYYNRPGSIVNTVRGEDRLSLAKYLLERAALSKENEKIYLGQAKSRLLWYLKNYTFTEPDRAVTKECLRIMRSGLPLIVRSNLFSSREKAHYIFKCFFPRVRSLKTMLKQ